MTLFIKQGKHCPQLTLRSFVNNAWKCLRNTILSPTKTLGYAMQCGIRVGQIGGFHSRLIVIQYREMLGGQLYTYCRFMPCGSTIKKLSDNENINLKIDAQLFVARQLAQSGKQDKTFTCPS
jgi:hypothetical protein